MLGHESLIDNDLINKAEKATLADLINIPTLTLYFTLLNKGEVPLLRSRFIFENDQYAPLIITGSASTMLKKYTILLSRNNLQSVHSAQSRTSPSPSGCRKTQQRCRTYAMVADGHSKYDHGRLRWPEVTAANAIPTPYQIFNQRKGSPYSKQRFYELVKLYHPDRHDHSNSEEGLSYATKVERYRLVVAANNVLSDPVKRGAYDCYGAGWNGQPDVAGPRDTSEQSATWGSYSGRGWGGGPRGPSQNATWYASYTSLRFKQDTNVKLREDWERWYSRDAKGPQEPRFVSNSAFVSLIVIFAALGGIGQATRVGNYSMNFLEQRDALHDNISKDLIRRRKETATAFSSREERIDSFLRQRDPIAYRPIDPREEGYRKTLPPPEICSSEDIKERPMDNYRSNNIPNNG